MSDADRLFQTLGVSRETAERLCRFGGLVRKWNPAINLVSRSTLDHLEDRHIADSFQLISAAPLAPKKWLDLGSGGGFPGLVVAIAAEEIWPELRVSLVESDQRKAAFLSTAARELGLSVNVHSSRIEALDPQEADVVSARALAPLVKLIGYAGRHLSPQGTALFPKGASAQEEIDAALETWRFSYQKIPSATDPGSVVLKIEGIASV